MPNPLSHQSTWLTVIFLRDLRVQEFGLVTGTGGSAGFFDFIVRLLKNTMLQDRVKRNGITRKVKI
jgi:hypothetical protein